MVMSFFFGVIGVFKLLGMILWCKNGESFWNFYYGILS